MADFDLRHILQLVDDEERRSRAFLHLTANESCLSRTARKFMSSDLDDLYYMGPGDEDDIIDFNPFTFRPLGSIARLISRAEEVVRERLSASIASLRPLSGVHAMTCAILAATDPGDTVMSVGLEHGGHFATGVIVERSGRRHITTSYDLVRQKFDAQKMAREFHRANAKALYLDVSCYLTPHNLREIRAELGDDAVVIYDASHTLGLILAGQFQEPLREGADVVCGNTHKTLPGPQKGLIAFRGGAFAERANAIINSGLFSSCHTPATIALAVTILEMSQFGAEYAQEMVRNANLLGKFLEQQGYCVRRTIAGEVSDNHQVHLFAGRPDNYRTLFSRLKDNNISINFERNLGSRIYIRMGTQAITRKGMRGVSDMAVIAELVSRALEGQQVSGEVAEFVASYPEVHYSFDRESLALGCRDVDGERGDGRLLAGARAGEMRSL